MKPCAMLFIIFFLISACSAKSDKSEINAAIENQIFTIDFEYLISEDDKIGIRILNQDYTLQFFHIVKNEINEIKDLIVYRFDKPKDLSKVFKKIDINTLLLISSEASYERGYVLKKINNKWKNIGEIEGSPDFIDGYFLGKKIISGAIYSFEHNKYNIYKTIDNAVQIIEMPDNILNFLINSNPDFYTQFSIAYTNRKEIVTKDWINQNIKDPIPKDELFDQMMSNFKAKKLSLMDMKELIRYSDFYYKVIDEDINF